MSNPGTIKCPNCAGVGKVTVFHAGKVAPRPCRTCKGSGRIRDEKPKRLGDKT